MTVLNISIYSYEIAYLLKAPKTEIGRPAQFMKNWRPMKAEKRPMGAEAPKLVALHGDGWTSVHVLKI